MPVSFNGPRFKEAYMDFGMKLIDTLKSNMAFLIKVLPILKEIVNILGPLHLGGSFL